MNTRKANIELSAIRCPYLWSNGLALMPRQSSLGTIALLLLASYFIILLLFFKIIFDGTFNLIYCRIITILLNSGI